MLGSNPQTNEQVLAQRAVSDPEAFAILFDRYFPLIHKYLTFRVDDASTADDLTSQIFEKMLTSLKNYNSVQAPFGAWLFGIARHTVGNYFRSQKIRQWLPLEKIMRVSSRDPQPEEDVLRGETDDLITQALQHLSERERDLVGLKFASGFTNRKIAKMTGISENHVGVLLYRALRTLRKELEKEKDHDE